MSSSPPNGRELDAVTELALWKQLIFDAEMPPPQEKRHDDPSRSQIPPPYTVPLPLPPETYTYLIHALLSLQGSGYPHNLPPTPPWARDTASPISTASMAGPPSFYPTLIPPVPLPLRVLPQSTSSSQPAPSPAPSPTTTSTAQDPEETEDEASITEDKRRRNTAASARFRIKKKLKTLDLERTVTNLTSRAEDLEREANDLRRENAWLKEIVLLKGRNLAAQAPAPGNQHDEAERDDRA